MKIVSKREADKILVNSLFQPINGKTLSRGVFDAGKYAWTGKASDYAGKEVIDIKGVHAVYVERRVDSDGPYAALLSIHEAEY